MIVHLVQVQDYGPKGYKPIIGCCPNGVGNVCISSDGEQGCKHLPHPAAIKKIQRDMMEPYYLLECHFEENAE